MHKLKGMGDEKAQRAVQRWKNTGADDIGLKAKDLIGIPWMVAFALRSSGWYLRSAVVWHKPNVMPSSVRDRPTNSYEHVFLLSKSPKYFYDADAIREPMTTKIQRRLSKTHVRSDLGKYRSDRRPDLSYKHDGVLPGNPAGRNKRDVWTINTRPYKEAHFATFPPELALTCVKAGSSEHGCCARCGAPYVRVVERETYLGKGATRPMNKTPLNVVRAGWRDPERQPKIKLHGWKQNCSCKRSVPVPCVVLDPFNGAGTTGLVALATGRRYVGIDLNPKYLEITERRLKNPVLPSKKHSPEPPRCKTKLKPLW